MTYKQKLCVMMMLTTMGMAETMAQDYLSVYLNNGSAAQSFALADVGKITFDRANMTVGHLGTDRTIDLSTISTIKFDDGQTTAIAPTVANSTAINLTKDEFSAPGWQGSKGLAIYSMSGQILYQDRNWTGESVSISSLPKGSYIIKTSTKSIKFTK